uniref:Uncharacterized protein n=1 Tax=Arundo donax TaxID=35708 RepID=A0A0A9GLK8_ARUDO
MSSQRSGCDALVAPPAPRFDSLWERISGSVKKCHLLVLLIDMGEPTCGGRALV